MSYDFVVSDDGQRCEIFLLRPYKYVGAVIKAPDGHSWQEFARDNTVMWLPVNQALIALGVTTSDEHNKQNMKDLGF